MHSNCSEILVVLQRKLHHTIEDGKVAEFSEGDTIYIPCDFAHQTINIGNIDAVLSSPQQNVKRQENDLHIFSEGTPEIDRMLRFSDWLRSYESDHQA